MLKRINISNMTKDAIDKEIENTAKAIIKEINKKGFISYEYILEKSDLINGLVRNKTSGKISLW